MRLRFCLLAAALLGAAHLAPADHPRIVSLVPSNTEILFALGLGDQIVGVCVWCDYPPEAQALQKVGDFVHPNIEKIVSLRPDLVLAGRWQSTRTAHRLRLLGLRVLEIDMPQSVEGIFASILQIAKEVSREREGAALVAAARRRLEAVRMRAARLKVRPRVYIEVDAPRWTVGRRSFINDLVSICGGENIFADLDASAAQVSQEQIIARRPEIILSLAEKKEQVARRHGWDALEAVRARRIIDDIDPDLIAHPSHRIVEGAELLSRRFLDGR